MGYVCLEFSKMYEYIKFCRNIICMYCSTRMYINVRWLLRVELKINKFIFAYNKCTICYNEGEC